MLTKNQNRMLVRDLNRTDEQTLTSSAVPDPVNPLSAKVARTRNRDFRLQTRLFRNIFGQSKKSPFLWSVSASHPIVDGIQKLHNTFFAKGTDREYLPDNLHADDTTSDLNFSYDVLLTHIAIAAYRPHFAWQFPSAHRDESVPDLTTANLVVSPPNLLFQLQQVELPLWKMITELSERKRSALAIVRKMEKLIGELLDFDGWLQASEFAHFGLLAASWCRCHRILHHAGFELQPESQSYLDWMCRQLIRSLRRDGSILFGEFGTGLNANAFRAALLELTSDRDDRKLLESWFQKSDQRPKLKRTSAKSRLPAESSISEWAQVGVLQQGWYRGSPKVGMTFHSGEFQLELGQCDTWISGNCTPTIKIDGQVQLTTSEIGVNCNLRFDQADFVELEIEYGELTLQRQVLLLRDDHLLWIGDNLIGPRSSCIEYNCRYPLAPGVVGIAETENTEFYLRRKKSHCLVLPLALPEWKSAHSPGRLKVQDGLLSLNQTINGRGLSAPLVFDLNPKRSTKPRTWRRLSVAEKMEMVGPDIAAAYRVQIGRKQWLFYRSIAEKGNRTFLGQNYADDFFAARIDIKGKVETILEVE